MLGKQHVQTDLDIERFHKPFQYLSFKDFLSPRLHILCCWVVWCVFDNQVSHMCISGSVQKDLSVWEQVLIQIMVTQVLIALAGPSFHYSDWWLKTTGRIFTNRYRKLNSYDYFYFILSMSKLIFFLYNKSGWGMGLSSSKKDPTKIPSLK